MRQFAQDSPAGDGRRTGFQFDGADGRMDGVSVEPTPQSRPDATAPAVAPDGVDLTLIRWMLSLTPAERLRVLQGHQDAIEALRKSGSPWTSARS
jgi:hypothetical protein